MPLESIGRRTPDAAAASASVPRGSASGKRMGKRVRYPLEDRWQGRMASEHASRTARSQASEDLSSQWARMNCDRGRPMPAMFAAPQSFANIVT